MSKFYITPLLAVTIIMFASFALYAQEREDQTSWQDNQVFLPKPDKSGGISLMKALNLRKTSRNISSKDISDRKLSNILWAAAGINRPDGRKTSPTAMNKQEISSYIHYLNEHFKPKTVKRKLASLHAFFEELVFNEVLQDNPMHRIRYKIQEEKTKNCKPDNDILEKAY